MAYMTYDPSLYRTGFRPYGHTNPWSATQLNGMSVHEALGGSASFHPWVLEGMGQSHPFTERGGWGLHGLGDAPICLDQAQNPIDCQDPNCTYGDCGAVSTGPLPTGACLDQKENRVMCNDPECTYGDCLPPTGATRVRTPTQIQLPPGPSPRVGYPSASAGSWKSSIINGIPDVAVYGAGLLAAVLLMDSGGRRRR